MEEVESIGKNKTKVGKFRILFLRGRRESSHIEIVEYVDAENAQKAVDLALEMADKFKWHVERVERLVSEET